MLAGTPRSPQVEHHAPGAEPKLYPRSGHPNSIRPGHHKRQAEAAIREP